MGGICRFAEQSAVFENYWADCFPHDGAVPKKTGSPPCKHGYSLSFCNLVSSSPALSHAQNRPIGLTRCFAAILLMRRRSFLAQPSEKTCKHVLYFADIWMAELSIHKYLIDSLLYNFFIFSIINKYTKIKRRKLYGKKYRQHIF